MVLIILGRSMVANQHQASVSFGGTEETGRVINEAVKNKNVRGKNVRNLKFSTILEGFGSGTTGSFKQKMAENSIFHPLCHVLTWFFSTRLHSETTTLTSRRSSPTRSFSILPFRYLLGQHIMVVRSDT
jgi:hypothetical protein